MNNRRKMKQMRSRQGTHSGFRRRSSFNNCCSQILYLLTCCFCRSRRSKSKECGSRRQDPEQDIDTRFVTIEHIHSERVEASSDVDLRTVVTHRAQESDQWASKVITGQTKASEMGFMNMIPNGTTVIRQQRRSFASSAAKVVAMTKLLSSSQTISDLALGIMSTPRRFILVFGKMKRTDVRSRFFELQGTKVFSSSAPSIATTSADRTYQTGEATNMTVAKIRIITRQKKRLFRNKTADVVYNNVLNLIDDSVRIVLIERQGQLKEGAKIAKSDETKEISTQKMPQTRRNAVVCPGRLRTGPPAIRVETKMKQSMELTKPGIDQQIISRIQRPGLTTRIIFVSHQQTQDMIRQMLQNWPTQMQKTGMIQRCFGPQETEAISRRSVVPVKKDGRRAIATTSRNTWTKIRPLINQIEKSVFNDVLSMIDRTVMIALIQRHDAQSDFGRNLKIAQSVEIQEIPTQMDEDDVSEFISDIIKNSILLIMNEREMEARDCNYSDDFEASSSDIIPEEIESAASGDEVFEFFPNRFGDSKMQVAIEGQTDSQNKDNKVVSQSECCSTQCEYSDDVQSSSEASIPEESERASSGDEVGEFVSEMIDASKQVVGMEGGTFNAHNTEQMSSSQTPVKYGWGNKHPGAREANQEDGPESRCFPLNCEEYYGDSDSSNDASNITAMRKRRRTSTMKTRKPFSLPDVNAGNVTTTEAEQTRASPHDQKKRIITKHRPHPAPTSTLSKKEYSDNETRMQELTSIQQEIDNDLLELDRKMKKRRSGLSPADIFLKEHFERTSALPNQTGVFLTSLMEDPDNFEVTSDLCFPFAELNTDSENVKIGRYSGSPDSMGMATAEDINSVPSSSTTIFSHDNNPENDIILEDIDKRKHPIDETNIFS